MLLKELDALLHGGFDGTHMIAGDFDSLDIQVASPGQGGRPGGAVLE